MGITPDLFEELLHAVGPHIKKKCTRWRDSISARDRLAITLRCLVTGETFKSLSAGFNYGRTTIAKIVRETCKAIWEQLRTAHLSMPCTPDDWLQVAEEFEQQWQLPNCCGCLASKYITVECHGQLGSANFNHKRSFDNILMAVSDSHYRFLVVDFGYRGTISGSGAFSESLFGRCLINNRLPLPNERSLPNSSISFPYYFITDDAFPLMTNLLRPFPQKSEFTHQECMYNYRLGRASRIADNAFGILTTRFKIYQRPLNFCDDTVGNMVMATLVLHNFLLAKSEMYCPSGFVDNEDADHNVSPGQWRNEIVELGPYIDGNLGENVTSVEAEILREQMSTYLSGPGSVKWQDAVVKQLMLSEEQVEDINYLYFVIGGQEKNQKIPG